jgi:hypothetical protein
MKFSIPIVEGIQAARASELTLQLPPGVPVADDTAAPRSSRPGLLRWIIAASLVVMLAACDSAVSAPNAFNEERCAVPASLAASVYTHAFPSTALHPALLHAAGPMASVLGEGELTNELRESIKILGSASGPELHDTHCRLVVIASAALRRMADTPETRPDRDGMHLVLALLANALVTEKP